MELKWCILAEVRVFGGLSNYDTLLTRYHNPHFVATMDQVAPALGAKDAEQVAQAFYNKKHLEE